MIELNGFFIQLLIGTKLTIIVACGALILGLILGLIGAAGSLCSNKIIRTATLLITSLIRGLPELIVIFTLYFGGTILLSKLFHHYVELNALTAGIFALSLIFAAYATETFRGAFLAVAKGQKEAAQALGLPAIYTFFHITLPQAWRHALPGLSNLWLVLLKDTALISLIGLTDLMNKAQIAANETFKPFTFYFAAAFLYLVMTTASQLIMKFLIKEANKYENKQ